MSDIAIRKQNENKPALATERAWDPWRTMRSLLSWDPFREMAAFPTLDEGTLALSPAFEVKETKDAYEFKADVPGIHDKDLEVSMTGNRLTISGKREAEKEDKSGRYYTYERSYGSFMRSFSLPDGADTDKVRASLDKGVLSISIPKVVPDGGGVLPLAPPERRRAPADAREIRSGGSRRPAAEGAREVGRQCRIAPRGQYEPEGRARELATPPRGAAPSAGGG
jgi:HSP20 family protein